MDGVPYPQPLAGPEPQYVPWGVLLVRPIGHPPRPVPPRAADQRSRAYPTLLRVLRWGRDWNEASEIRHLLKDILPGHWKRRVEDEEKKRAKKRVAVRIMAAEDTHAGIMEFFRRNLGEPNRMLGLKNAVYVEVFGDTMGQRLMRLNNVEWRRGEPLRLQVIFARMSLDEIVKYITVELKLNAKNEAHVQDRQGHGQRGHREDRHHREIQEDTANSAEDGSGSGQDHWTGSREDHEEVHFLAFVAHNVRDHGQDRSRWNRVGPKGQRSKEDREPTGLVPGVQVSARRVLGLLWQGKEPCTRPPSVQGV